VLLAPVETPVLLLHENASLQTNPVIHRYISVSVTDLLSRVGVEFKGARRGGATKVGTLGTLTFDPASTNRRSPEGGRRIRFVTNAARKEYAVQVWDSAAGRAVSPPIRHANRITSASFSPDGRRVLTASSDGTARVWDAATGLPVTPPLTPGAGVVYSAAFGPDGRRLVTAGADGTARVWNLPTDPRPTDDLVKLAHLYAGGRIDPAGGFVPLTADETKSLFAELRDRYPADFAVPPSRARAWHREQLADAERDRDWFAAAFHLRALLREFAAGDAGLTRRLADVEAKLNPREVLPPPRPAR
jgi:hypothetical protein